MELEGGGGNSGRDGTFDGLSDGRRFGLAGGEQENFPRFQNRADAHGDGAAGTLLARREEFRVVVHRFLDRKSTRLNSSHLVISYAVFCLKKKKSNHINEYSTP